MNLNPSEVWLADLGLAAKTRPIVIVSRYDSDPPRALVLYVPVTIQNRGSSYEVELPKVSFLRSGSVANVQGLGSIPIARLELTLDVGIRNRAFSKNFSVKGGISDVSISSSPIASILAQSVLEVLFIASDFFAHPTRIS
jgi:mRNA interferase MazF